MKAPVIKSLYIPEYNYVVSKFSSIGKLAISRNNLTYLDIDDDYVHQLFPLLKDYDTKKPDYFSKGSAGAHITVIYPEENKIINSEDLNREHSFIVKGIVTAKIGLKGYYVILVESQSLLKLRRHYRLSDTLCFKGYSIGFHITIGVRNEGNDLSK